MYCGHQSHRMARWGGRSVGARSSSGQGRNLRQLTAAEHAVSGGPEPVVRHRVAADVEVRAMRRSGSPGAEANSAPFRPLRLACPTSVNGVLHGQRTLDARDGGATEPDSAVIREADED